ncbi:MAG: hypothetical protein DDT25_01006 [Chloroflexi bacterium]|nr:hypothetical protein [Chloroflexota bacterium]
MDESCWQWVDWTPCYRIGDTMHGNKVELSGWCPKCSKMRLRAKGYGHSHPDKDTPHFKPDFKGAVTLACSCCGYNGDFFVNVPERLVALLMAICSKDV